MSDDVSSMKNKETKTREDIQGLQDLQQRTQQNLNSVTQDLRKTMDDKTNIQVRVMLGHTGSHDHRVWGHGGMN